MRQIAKGILRDVRSRRASLAILIALEGIGVAALFVGSMLIHAVLVRPVPFPRAADVVQVWNTQPERGITHLMLSRRETEFYREQLTSLESLVAFTVREVIVSDDGTSQSRRAVTMVGDLCELLGVSAVVGRCLTRDDAAPGAPRAAMMRAGAAFARYGDQAKALGADITIDGQQYQVVGVVSDRLYLRNYLSHFFGPVDYLLPLPAAPNEDAESRLMLLGRLVPPATFATATAEIEALSRGYAALVPNRNEGRIASLITLHEETVEYARPQAMAISMGAALLAMLVIFNNLVVRKAEAGRRRRLLLLMTALGASSRRLLTEEAGTSLVTLAASGVLAWNLSLWLITEFVQRDPWGVSGLQNNDVSLSYFALALTLVGGSSVAGGLIVVRNVLSSGDSFIASPSRTADSTRAEARGARTMMLTQCAITAVLLGCTLLLTKTMWNLTNVNLGVRAENLLTVRTDIPSRVADTRERRREMMRRVLDPETLPSAVESISVMNDPPLSMRAQLRPVEIEGIRAANGGPPIANYRVVSSNYFDVADLPIVSGRTFAGPQQPRAAEYLVNQAFVQRVLNGRDPIGTPVRIPEEGGVWNDGVPSEGIIVGVVGDVKHWGPDRPVPAEIYISYDLDPPVRFTVIFRTQGNNELAVAGMQQRLRAIAPELAAFPMRLLQSDVDTALRERWFAMALFGLFAVAAVLVTALGLYGVASGYVTSRHGEIAVRISIGATRRDVLELVARQAMMPAVIGAVVGAIALLGAGRMLQVWLFEVRASDPSLLVMVPAGIIGVAFVAVLGPLRAALRVQAIELLRGR